MKELDTVVLLRDIDPVKAGEIGAIVHEYPSGLEFEVEFDPFDITKLITVNRNDLVDHDLLCHQEINSLTHEDMARLVRFAPSGHTYFIKGTRLCYLFEERFKSFGGMTTEISRKIGWDAPSTN